MIKPTNIVSIEQQYKTLKEKHPNELVLVRLGDFYEAFYDDAKKLAKATNTTLIQRNGISLAGIPCHAAKSYIATLETAKHQVFIVEDFLR